MRADPAGRWHDEAMTIPSHQRLRALLADPAAPGDELFAASRAVIDDFERGEGTEDGPGLMLEGLTRAGAAGNADAWLLMGQVLVRYAGRAAAIDAFQLADRSGSREGALGWVVSAYHCRSDEHAAAAAARLDELLRDTPQDAELLLYKGYFLSQGYGVSADVGLAVRYLLASVEQGGADAAFEVSVHYAVGSGVGQDFAAADHWTRRAAELGSARAMANLGGMYATGLRVPQDPDVALSWYSRAADAGHAKAAYTAGVMCLTGDSGVRIDKDRALGYFDRARRLGYDVDGELGILGHLL